MNAPGRDKRPERKTASRTPIEPIPVGVAVFARDGRLQLYNRHFPGLIGLPRDRLVIGLPFDALVAALQQGSAMPLHRTTGFHWQHTDGRSIEVRSEPLQDGGHMTIVTDVTPLRETADALLLSRAAAEAADAAKRRFLASITTELRTPLTTILSETAAIAGHSATDEAAQRACAAIDTAARALLGLVDTILDRTGLETGRLELANDCVDLHRLLRGILRRFDQKAAAAEVAMVIDLPVSLPAVQADEHRLRQVISDVVANALACTGPRGSVSIRARHDWASGGLRIEVQDTGPGIEEQDLEYLFEPFPQRAPANRHARKAIGLGLSIGRMLMRAHGGELSLRSMPGHGTTVTLSLPPERVMRETGPDTN